MNTLETMKAEIADLKSKLAAANAALAALSREKAKAAVSTPPAAKSAPVARTAVAPLKGRDAKFGAGSQTPTSARDRLEASIHAGLVRSGQIKE